MCRCGCCQGFMLFLSPCLSCVHFPMLSCPFANLTTLCLIQVALSRPILFSNWLSKDYTAVDQEELREYVQARLKVFYEEELDIPLVLFNEVLDHVLRIDRIFKQKQVCMCCVVHVYCVCCMCIACVCCVCVGMRVCCVCVVCVCVCVACVCV